MKTLSAKNDFMKNYLKWLVFTESGPFCWILIVMLLQIIGTFDRGWERGLYSWVPVLYSIVLIMSIILLMITLSLLYSVTYVVLKRFFQTSDERLCFIFYTGGTLFAGLLLFFPIYTTCACMSSLTREYLIRFFDRFFKDGLSICLVFTFYSSVFTIMCWSFSLCFACFLSRKIKNDLCENINRIFARVFRFVMGSEVLLGIVTIFFYIRVNFKWIIG